MYMPAWTLLAAHVACGLSWVRLRHAGRDAYDHAGYTLSAWATGWEWPRPADAAVVGQNELRLRQAAAVACVGVALVGLAAPRRRGSPSLGGWRGAILWTWLLVPAAAWWALSRGDGRLGDNVTPPWWVLLAAAAFAGAFAALRWRRWRAIPAKTRAAGFAWVGVPAALSVGGGVAALALLGEEGRTSVWMPRYLGFCLPAFVPVAAAALDRLPARPLRWSAVAVVVAVNLAGFGRRVVADTEPPSDRVMADLAAADADPATAVVLQYERGLSPSLTAPGGGYPDSRTGIYYAA